MAMITRILRFNGKYEVTSNEDFEDLMLMLSNGAKVVSRHYDVKLRVLVYTIKTNSRSRARYRAAAAAMPPGSHDELLYRIADGDEELLYRIADGDEGDRDIRWSLTEAGIAVAKRAGPPAVHAASGGAFEIPEYTARKLRNCDDDFPTRTYKKHDLVFDLETQTVCRIAKIIMGGMSDYPEDPLFFIYGNEENGRLCCEICLPLEADKYRGSDWIRAAHPLDGDRYVRFRDPITDEKMITDKETGETKPLQQHIDDELEKRRGEST
jgi:hypothetical protein